MGERFFIIKSGKAVVDTKQHGQVAVLEDGDFFGEMALLDNKPRMASVVTASPSKLPLWPDSKWAAGPMSQIGQMVRDTFRIRFCMQCA